VTEPPAFSTAATADLDAPHTVNATLVLISPEPSSRTPSRARLSTPAFQGRGIDRRAGIELAGIDRRLDALEIDFVQPERERGVLEAALGKTTVERHLAAFEALDPHARARGLALAAAAAGLAGTGADAATDARALLARPRAVGEFVQFH
jgi:hypothetical protein